MKVLKIVSFFFLLSCQSSLSLKNNLPEHRYKNASAIRCGDGTTSLVLRKEYQKYFSSMKKLYQGHEEETCLSYHQKCGWSIQNNHKKLPQFILVIGLEGSAHHFWTKLLYTPVIECVWVNSRHYRRDVGDGVPRRTPAELRSGILEQMEIREREAPPRCSKILDSEDSFPTGAIRKPGRLFMHPDLVNLHAIDGDIVDMKYLVILRNTTDTVMSALRRDFVSSFEQGIHIAEHTMIHIEAALRLIPCHKIFIAHYEHILSDPLAFLEPLSDFLELVPDAKKVLKSRLEELKPSFPARQHHTLTQYKECKDGHLSPEACYQLMLSKMERFFRERSFMWPTFAANGYDLANS